MMSNSPYAKDRADYKKSREAWADWFTSAIYDSRDVHVQEHLKVFNKKLRTALKAMEEAEEAHIKLDIMLDAYLDKDEWG